MSIIFWRSILLYGYTLKKQLVCIPNDKSYYQTKFLDVFTWYIKVAFVYAVYFFEKKDVKASHNTVK